MGGHARGADQHAEAVLQRFFAELRRRPGGAVRAHDMRLKGDFQLPQDVDRFLYHRQIRVAAHQNTNFFHHLFLPVSS